MPLLFPYIVRLKLTEPWDKTQENKTIYKSNLFEKVVPQIRVKMAHI